VKEPLQVGQGRPISSTGGGTKTASSRLLPPIETRLWRSSPGCLYCPRTPERSNWCISRIKRTEIGKPSRTRASPWPMASM
jgi:hypothetical protein